MLRRERRQIGGQSYGVTQQAVRISTNRKVK